MRLPFRKTVESVPVTEDAGSGGVGLSVDISGNLVDGFDAVLRENGHVRYSFRAGSTEDEARANAEHYLAIERKRRATRTSFTVKEEEKL